MANPQSASAVRLEKRGPVEVVWLDHPPVNVLSEDVLKELAACLAEVEEDPTVRAVVLASAIDRAFAAGANLREMATFTPREAHRYGGLGQAITRRIEKLPLPVVAAVHGACLGGGCEIAQACDFIVASEDALFGQPEVNLGIMPGWGGTQRLPIWIGPQAARTWVFTGRTFPAAEAMSAGLVYAVVPRAELVRRAEELAAELAQKPPLAIAAAKYAMQRASDPALDGRLSLELALWERLFGTENQRRGMAAFLEKRPFLVVGRDEWPQQSQGFPWGPRAGRPVARRARDRRGKSKN